MLGQHADGSSRVVDVKNDETVWANSWVAGWDLDSQFTGYCFLAKKFDFACSRRTHSWCVYSETWIRYRSVYSNPSNIQSID